MIRKILFLVCLLFSFNALATDTRFCGTVVYSIKTSKIVRSQAEVRKFKKEWPCSTCTSDWEVDHTIPLVCGGCDTVENMSWMKKSIKTCAGTECKDRWEQQVYCSKPITKVYVP